MTLSAGVCSSENAGDADGLIRDTDRALYWAKHGGRNMTVIYSAEADDQRDVAEADDRRDTVEADDQRATAGARNSSPR